MKPSRNLLEYEQLKQRWIREHPNATPAEYEAFIRWLARWTRV